MHLIKDTLNSGMFTTLQPRISFHSAWYLKRNGLNYKKIKISALDVRVKARSHCAKNYQLSMFENSVLREVLWHNKTY